MFRHIFDKKYSRSAILVSPEFLEVKLLNTPVPRLSASRREMENRERDMNRFFQIEYSKAFKKSVNGKDRKDLKGKDLKSVKGKDLIGAGLYSSQWW